MMPKAVSLRTQLFVIGLFATIAPLLVLVGVVAVTYTTEDIGLDESGVVVEESTRSGMPIVIVVAAVLLAVVATLVVRWWSGRAVRAMSTITALANEIQAGSLDRRVQLAGAPAEMQALADSFDQMLDRLERASSTQRQLVEDVSHEMRTPLTALAVNNEVIRNHPAPTQADHDEAHERTHALVARLQLTIDDLLDAARRRQREHRQVDNDLMVIVRRVIDQHRSVDPDTPVVVAGPDTLRLGIDGPSIERALVNLVDNAARFSPPGSPIEVDVETDDTDAIVSVTDHGPGIAPEDLPHIFDRYYRTDRGDGPGIGLALVKQIADAHGSIDVVSPTPSSEAGTRFILHLRR